MGDVIFYATIVGGLVVVVVAVWYTIHIENRCYACLDDFNRKLQLANQRSEKLTEELKHYDRLREESDRLRNSIQSGVVEREGMRERIGNSDRRCEELSDEVASLKDKVSQVQAANKILDAANKKLCLDLDSSRQACGNAMDMLKKAEANVKHWQNDCTHYRKVFDSTEANLKKESRYWNNEYQSSRVECEGLKRELEKSRNEVENAKKDTDALRREMAMLHRDHSTLVSRMGVIRQYAAEVQPVPESATDSQESPKPGSSLTLTNTLENLKGVCAANDKDIDRLSERLANLVMEKAVNGTLAP